MVDPQVAWDKLAQFECSQHLREFFQAEGINGVIGHASKCPISTWLKTMTDAPVVTVAGTIRVWAKNNAVDVNDVIFEHTTATSDFMNHFDGGIYRELIRPDE